MQTLKRPREASTNSMMHHGTIGDGWGKFRSVPFRAGRRRHDSTRSSTKGKERKHESRADKKKRDEPVGKRQASSTRGSNAAHPLDHSSSSKHPRPRAAGLAPLPLPRKHKQQQPNGRRRRRRVLLCRRLLPLPAPAATSPASFPQAPRARRGHQAGARARARLRLLAVAVGAAARLAGPRRDRGPAAVVGRGLPHRRARLRVARPRRRRRGIRVRGLHAPEAAGGRARHRAPLPREHALRRLHHQPRRQVGLPVVPWLPLPTSPLASASCV